MPNSLNPMPPLASDQNTLQSLRPMVEWNHGGQEQLVLASGVGGGVTVGSTRAYVGMKES